jgi:hypothetical protein
MGVAAAALLLVGIAAWLLLRGNGEQRIKDANLEVHLVASSAQVPILTAVRLNAVVTPASLADDRSLVYEWTAVEGTIIGKGAQVRWLAPWGPGTTKIQVAVHPAADEKKLVVAEVLVHVVDPGTPVAASKANAYEIQEVTFDQQEICSTGDVRVQIKAADQFGDSTWLVPRIKFPGTDPVDGFDVIGRLNMLQSQQPQDPKGAAIQVTLFDMRNPQKQVASQTALLKIDSCPEAQRQLQLHVLCSLDDVEWNLTCRARHMEENQAWLKDHVKSYEWSLVDQEAPGLPLRTSYSSFVYPIPIETLVSDRAVHTWLVQVKAELTDGRVLTGRGSVSFVDFLFANQARVKKLLLMMSNGTSWEENQRMNTTFKIRNPYPEEVVFEGIELSSGPCAPGVDEVPEQLREGAKRLGLVPPTTPGKAPPAVRVVDAVSIIGVDHLAAGSEWQEFTWRVPFQDNVCNTTARVLGHGEASGMPVELSFMTRTGAGTRVAVESPSILLQRDAARLMSKERGYTVLYATSDEVSQLLKDKKLRDSREYVLDWKKQFGLPLTERDLHPRTPPLGIKPLRPPVSPRPASP